LNGTQLVPMQHPVRQLLALQLGGEHVPAWQVLTKVHAAQAAPPTPHWAFVSRLTGTQVVPLQQPTQLLALQVVPPEQAPARQFAPPEHAEHAAPRAPH
jgi:hypothetical protein